MSALGRTGAVLCCAALVGLGTSACHRADTREAAPTTAPTTTTVLTTTTLPTTTTAPPPPPPDVSAAMSDNHAAAAGAIAAAEHATLDLATPPAVVGQAAQALQYAYRKIGALDPSVEAAVSAALPDDVKPALALNVAAT